MKFLRYRSIIESIESYGTEVKHGHEYLRFFDMDVLIQILTDWSTATGIGIIAVDEKGDI